MRLKSLLLSYSSFKMLALYASSIVEKPLTGFILASFCTIAAWYFGQPLIFDPLMLIVAILLAFIFRSDLNLLSLLGILVLEKIAEEITWALADNSILLKCILYMTSLLIIHVTCIGWTKLGMLILLGSALSSEIYWHIIDYQAPWIFWPVWQCALVLLARHACAFRVFLMIKLTGDERYDFIKLDDYCYRVFTLMMFMYSLITIEYYIRHLLGLQNITFVYYASDYFGNALSLYIVYMIVIESTKHLRHSNIPA